MIKPHRQPPAVAGLEIEIEYFRLHVAGRAADRREQRRAVAGHDVLELQSARANLREIVGQPLGQRGIEISHAAAGFEREEPGRRMIEIVDRVLEILENVFLPFAVARHIDDGPHSAARFMLFAAQRPHLQLQPAHRLLAGTGDAHFLAQPPPFTSGLEQAIDRLGNIRSPTKTRSIGRISWAVCAPMSCA